MGYETARDLLKEIGVRYSLKNWTRGKHSWCSVTGWSSSVQVKAMMSSEELGVEATFEWWHGYLAVEPMTVFFAGEWDESLLEKFIEEEGLDWIVKRKSD